MVDLGRGQDGPLEHAFSNSVFIIPGIIVVGLTGDMEFDPNDEFLDADLDGDVPSMEKIESMLDGMDLTDEERDAFLRQLKGESRDSADLFTPLNIAAFFFAALLFNLMRKAIVIYIVMGSMELVFGSGVAFIQADYRWLPFGL